VFTEVKLLNVKDKKNPNTTILHNQLNHFFIFVVTGIKILKNKKILSVIILAEIVIKI